MVARFGFIEAKKGVWGVVKISTGPWVQYADHEQALAKKDREIAALKGGLGCSRSHPHEEMSEICALKTEIVRWKAAHDEMVARNRLLRDRPDLPADRICAHDEWVRKLAEKDREIESKEIELGKLDAELIVRNAAYNQLMAQAVRFARLAPCKAAYDFLQSDEAQAFLKEHT